jgi:hypothetical protein
LARVRFFLDQAFKGVIGYGVRVLIQEDKEYMTINVKPLGDRVLVQPLEEKEVKKGGIIIPDTAKEKPQEGTGRSRRYRQARRQWQEDRVQRQSRRQSPRLEIRGHRDKDRR